MDAPAIPVLGAATSAPMWQQIDIHVSGVAKDSAASRGTIESDRDSRVR